MQTAAETKVLDLEFKGTALIIAAHLWAGNDGLAIVDPGPASALQGLTKRLAELGRSVADIETILLTHIHLDHAGATGTLVKQNPRIRVLVHERGATHLVNPERLLSSAKRLYGEAMDRLWGEFLPVPAAQVQALAGGERVVAGGRTLEVLYTPGHAVHHVSYFDPNSGDMFTGDTAGVRIDNQRCVIPVTPPPDIDVEMLRGSLAQILARRPQRFFVTHFGAADDVEWHVDDLQRRLAAWSTLVRESLMNGHDDASRAARFEQQVIESLRPCLSEPELNRWAKIGSARQSWYGLARYWRKRGQQ